MAEETEGERRWRIGVRGHALNALIWDEFVPDDDARRGDEDTDIWDVLADHVGGTATQVWALLEQAYDLGWRHHEFHLKEGERDAQRVR